jgi:hypothetical protein
MEETMDAVRIGTKGQYLNTLEKYYTYKISKEQLHMNDTNIDEHNPIYKEQQKIYDAPTSHTTQPSPQHHEMYKYISYHAAHTHTHTHTTQNS